MGNKKRLSKAFLESLNRKKPMELNRYIDMLCDDRVLRLIIRAAIQGRLGTGNSYLAIEYIIGELEADFIIKEREKYDLRNTLWHIYRDINHEAEVCGGRRNLLKPLRPIAKKMEKENPGYQKCM